jgi:hypothetical protein
MSSSDGPEQRPVVPARQARQGVTGHNVRYVLGFSIAAVIIVFGIIWLILFHVSLRQLLRSTNAWRALWSTAGAAPTGAALLFFA